MFLISGVGCGDKNGKVRLFPCSSSVCTAPCRLALEIYVGTARGMISKKILWANDDDTRMVVSAGKNSNMAVCQDMELPSYIYIYTYYSRSHFLFHYPNITPTYYSSFHLIFHDHYLQIMVGGVLRLGVHRLDSGIPQTIWP